MSNTNYHTERGETLFNESEPQCLEAISQEQREQASERQAAIIESARNQLSE